MKNDGSVQENEEPNPEKIFETWFAFSGSRILVTGVNLEVFTHIGNGHFTIAGMAKADVVAFARPLSADPELYQSGNGCNLQPMGENDV